MAGDESCFCSPLSDTHCLAEDNWYAEEHCHMQNKEGNWYFIGNTLNLDTTNVLSETYDNAEECSKLHTVWDQAKWNFNGFKEA